MDRPPTADVPRSPLAWVPWYWSRVLFPGTAGFNPAARDLPPSSPLPPEERADREQASRRGHPRGALLLLLILPGVLLYPCRDFHLLEPDEGRYAEIPREMLARGEWIVPLLQGEPYLDKPPLLYWLVMLAYRLLGVEDGVARLVP